MAETMTMAASIKAVGAEHNSGLEDGQFRALVSVFGNVDSSGEVVVPGAFADTLQEWEKRGAPIPLVWSHQWDNPFANIGHVVKAKETSDGLEIVGELDLDGNDNPTARYVHKLLKTRRINQFSFAYDVDEGGWAAKAEPAEGEPDEVFELRKLSLHETGPCLIGVNRATELREIKHVARREAERVARQQNSKTPDAESSGQGTTSQVPVSRDDGPKSIAAPSDPPRLNPASVHALLNAHLIDEGK